MLEDIELEFYYRICSIRFQTWDFHREKYQILFLVLSNSSRLELQALHVSINSKTFCWNDKEFIPLKSFGIFGHMLYYQQYVSVWKKGKYDSLAVGLEEAFSSDSSFEKIDLLS